MINPQELRLGNWYVNDCDDSYIKLAVADLVTAVHDKDWLLPIPLTPEILEAAGFEKYYDSCFHIEYDMYDVDNGRMNRVGIVLQIKYEVIQFKYRGELLKHIKYLHQLQNLYFALTGEELTIKLNTTEK